MDDKDRRIKELQQTIEKLKCCGNCGLNNENDVCMSETWCIRDNSGEASGSTDDNWKPKENI